MFSKRSFLIHLALLLVLMTGAVSAGPITQPADLILGDPYRLVFVTNATVNRGVTNIGFYNAHATAQATGQSELNALGTNWYAIVSTMTVDARVNSLTDPTPSGPTGVPIYNTNGVRIADDYDQLWGTGIGSSLYASIQYDQNGTDANPLGGIIANPWTGTDNDGTVLGGVDSGTLVGNITSTVGTWIRGGNASPTPSGRSIYAISGQLTANPEPGSALLLLFGIVGLGAMRDRRN